MKVVWRVIAPALAALFVQAGASAAAKGPADAPLQRTAGAASSSPLAAGGKLRKGKGKARRGGKVANAARKRGEEAGNRAVPAASAPAAHRADMLEVLQQFRILVRSIRSHNDSVETSSGMSGAQLWAMARIAERPGIKVGELAEDLAIHQSTASNMLERLTSQGLVEKRRIGEDQRVVRLFATARGRDALESAPQPLIGVLQQALSELPGTSLVLLQERLGELIGLMKVRDISAARGTPLSDV